MSDETLKMLKNKIQEFECVKQNWKTLIRACSQQKNIDNVMWYETRASYLSLHNEIQDVAARIIQRYMNVYKIRRRLAVINTLGHHLFTDCLTCVCSFL